MSAPVNIVSGINPAIADGLINEIEAWYAANGVAMQSGNNASGGANDIAHSLGGSTLGDPNDPRNSKNDSNNSLKILSRSEANKAARENGFRGAEDFKHDITFGKGSQFNMHRNTQTGEIILKSIRGNIQIPTGFYY